MKVILLSEVKALGKKGQVVEVAEGYARNFLLPRQLAAEASSGALTVLAEQRRAQEKRAAQGLSEAKALAELLESKPLSVQAKCGGSGRLFGTVTSAQIADAIAQTFAVVIDRHKIDVKSSIRTLGSYPVEIKVGKSIVAKATVNVVAA